MLLNLISSCLCLLLLTTISDQDTTHVYLQLSGTCGGMVSWEQADRCCRREGVTLPHVTTREENYDLLKAMNNNSVDSIWLGIRKSRLSDWTWVDGRPHKTRLENINGNCGVFNTTSITVEAVHCSDGEFSLICEVKGCDGCASLGPYSETCYNHGERCFIILYGNHNWYDARAMCRLFNWDLVVFSSHELLRLASINIESGVHWIGLRKEEWKSEINGTSFVYPLASNWGEGEPTGKGTCAIAIWKGDAYEWKSSLCDDTNNFLCYSGLIHAVQSTKLVTERLSVTADTGTFSHGKGVTLTILVVVICLICAITTTTIVFLVCRKGRRAQTSTFADDEMREPLINMSITDKELQRNVATFIKSHFSKLDLWFWEGNIPSVPMDKLYSDQVLRKVPNRPHLREKETFSSYHDLKFEYGDASFIYVEGQAGTGKTTLCRKILSDWSSHYSSRNLPTPDRPLPFTNKCSFILPIFLNLVQKGEDIYSYLQRQLKLSEKETQQLSTFVNSWPQSCLFILDGYDEYDPATSKDITDLALWKHSLRVNVMLTSRHSPFRHFSIDNHPHFEHMVLLGFSDESMQTFVRKYFCTNTDDEHSKLCHALFSSNIYSQVGKIPAVLFLICVLWRNLGTLPETMTEFINALVRFVCGRYEMKNRKENEPVIEGDMMTKYHENLKEIGLIAVEGSLKEPTELSFEQKRVYGKMGEISKKLGFFKQEYSSEKGDMVSFPHESIQHYFAAYYLKHSEEKQKIFVKQLLNSPKIDGNTKTIMKYLFGLGGNNSLEKIDAMLGSNEPKLSTMTKLCFLSENPNKDCRLPNTVHLTLSEHHDHVISRMLSQDGNAVKEIILEINKVEEALLVKTLNAPYLKSLQLQYKCDSMSSPLARQKFPKSMELFENLEEITVRGFKFIESTAETRTLVHILKYPSNLKFLNFLNNSNLPIREMIETIKEPKEIRFRNNDILPDLMNCLFSSTSKWPHIEVLDTFGNKEAVDDYRYLCESLPKLSHLRELRLCDSLRFEAVEELISSLEKLDALRVLDLSAKPKLRRRAKAMTTDLKAHGRSEENVGLGKILTGLTSLRELTLRESINLNSITPILCGLEELKCLTILDISGTTATTTVYRRLGEALFNQLELSQLRLCDCPFEENGAALATLQGISEMRKLTVLEFGYYTLNENGLLALSNAFPHLPKLKELIMYFSDSYNPDSEDIGERKAFEKAWENLVNKLAVCSNLHTLDLQGNQIGHGTVDNLAKNLLNMPKLKFLRIDRCRLDKVSPLVELFRRLSESPSIEELDISNNVYGDQLIHAMHRVEDISTLRKLDMSGNGMSVEVKEEMIKRFRHISKPRIIIDI